MAGINSIGGIGGIMPASMPATQKIGSQGSGDFSQALKSAMHNVNESQNASTQAITDLVSGRTDDVLPAVSAMAKADLSFKLLVGVRNKVIEAYKQTMNMQV
jgi:flagellar hook-basal body complex protein FliE